MFKIENYTLLQEFDNMIPYSKNVEKKIFSHIQNKDESFIHVQVI